MLRSFSRPSEPLWRRERAERTLDRYRRPLDLHVIPVLGERQIQKITADQLARLIGSGRTSGLAPWTIRGIVTPLRRVFDLAARRGYVGENPMLRLHRDELPRGRAQSEPRTLTADEVQYAHEFEHARGLDDVRDSIDAAFGASRI